MPKNAYFLEKRL